MKDKNFEYVIGKLVGHEETLWRHYITYARTNTTLTTILRNQNHTSLQVLSLATGARRQLNRQVALYVEDAVSNSKKGGNPLSQAKTYTCNSRKESQRGKKAETNIFNYRRTNTTAQIYSISSRNLIMESITTILRKPEISYFSDIILMVFHGHSHARRLWP